MIVIQNLLLIIITIVSLLAYDILAHVWKKIRIILCIPIISVLIHLCVYGFYFTQSFMYIEAAIFFIYFIFLCIQKNTKKIFSIIIQVFLVLCLILDVGMNYFFHDISTMGYVDSFKYILSDMEQNYPLSEYKEIDYEYLEKKYVPMFEQADKDNDTIAAYITWLEYCYNFHDDHVHVTDLNSYLKFLSGSDLEGGELEDKAKERLAGNDYGFSIVTLTSGENVAILVDKTSKAYQEGIREGSVITKWDNIDIEKQKEKINVIYPGLGNFPSKKNEDIMKSFFLAGKGGETVTVTYLDSQGNEVTALCHSQGNYMKRLDSALRQFVYCEPSDNLSWKIIDETHAYLRLREEIWRNPKKSTLFAAIEMVHAMNNNYSGVSKMIKDQLEELQHQNVTDLIIDLRSNAGGDDFMGMALVRYLTNESFIYYCDGEFDENGEKKITEKHQLTGEKIWDDLPIVVLVNEKTVSAGDGLIYNLQRLDNVTVMGLTDSSSSFQATGGMATVCDSTMTMSYPLKLQLDENENIMIDTPASRRSSIENDVMIPVVKERIDELFNSNDDYELNYAIYYLEQMR